MLRPDANSNINLLEKGLIKRAGARGIPDLVMNKACYSTALSVTLYDGEIPHFSLPSLASPFFSLLPLQFSKLACRANHQTQ